MATIYGTQIKPTYIPQYITTGGELTPSGRRIYRHSCDEGSVLIFDFFGVSKSILVLDSKYRFPGTWGGGSGATRWVSNSLGNPYLNGSGFVSDIDMTDAELQSLWSNVASCATAATDASLNNYYYTVTVPNLNVTQFYAANIYEIMVIRIEANMLDQYDKYASSYPNYLAGNSNPKGYFGGGNNGFTWYSSRAAFSNNARVYEFSSGVGGMHYPILELN